MPPSTSTRRRGTEPVANRVDCCCDAAMTDFGLDGPLLHDCPGTCACSVPVTGGAGSEGTMGTTVSFDPEDIRHSRYIVLWGTNTIVTNLHLWPFIDEARRGGAKVVCVDPIGTRTAEAADWHLRPRPGTDQAL